MVLLFSGKRKSGKDYLTERLREILGDSENPLVNPVIVRLSGPIKQMYAEKHGLNYDELLGCGPYKEKHRLAMIAWSEKIR